MFVQTQPQMTVHVPSAGRGGLRKLHTVIVVAAVSVKVLERLSQSFCVGVFRQLSQKLERRIEHEVSEYGTLPKNTLTCQIYERGCHT